jgi:ketosteroid isomerase-like protein
MSKFRIFSAAAMLLASQCAFAQSPEQTWDADVRKFDSDYWQAFNQCDVDKLAQMNTEDLEFYHDRGGPMIGRDKFASTFKQNICGNPSFKIRREAVPGSLRVYPMRGKGQLYGAVISGEHLFYSTRKGGAETLDGRALFTHMLLLDKGTWKVSRVLSFDHGPAKAPGG